MDEKILNIFRKYSDRYVSGESLSRQLGISRTAIWKHIKILREIGYKIDAQPHSGYKLLAAPDRLLACEVSCSLKTKVVGRKIISFDFLDSTMDAAYNLAQSTTDEGVCIFAEGQAKGRGRIGRSWQSPKHKGIYMSVILRPAIAPNEISKITLVIAVSIAKAVRAEYGLEALIKWPNDVLIKGKKICGILTEMNAESDKINFLVAGIGINVNTLISELPDKATSMKEELGEKIDRVVLARAIMQELDKQYAIFNSQGFSSALSEWKKLSATLGKRVKTDFKNHSIEGRAVDVDESGALLVKMDNGSLKRIIAGDIFFAS